MMMAIGLSQHNVALFHVINHSFFKALLFLAAGAVIHSFSDEQDIRKMGGLIKFLPFTYTILLIGTLSLLATPFLSGFYSKDLIIELAYGHYTFSGIYAYILGSLTAFVTSFYSFRLISLVFLGSANGYKKSYLNSHESDIYIVIPLIILALFSIFFGYIFSDMFVGIGTDLFSNSLFIHPNNIVLVDTEFSISLIIKLLPTILSFLGATSALLLYNKYPEFIFSITETKLGKSIYTLLNSKYYFDVLYNNYIISKGFILSYNISKELDRGALELLGPYGLSNTLYNFGRNLSKFDTGIITTYALYITIGLLFFLTFVFSSLIFDLSINEILRIILILIVSFFISSS
jgi:NADH-ubiquinone oxidoreductase chain 5